MAYSFASVKQWHKIKYIHAVSYFLNSNFIIVNEELFNRDKAIHAEADEILEGKGLLSILKKYGAPVITGSYSLSLMTWRDLDIYLQADAISETDFFKMGGEIATAFHPVKMSFRNERIAKTEGLPNGLYWGIYLGNERKGDWKIDVWAVSKKECDLRIQFCKELEHKLTPAARQTILEIKSQCWQDPEYRRSYTSADIYKAVLEFNIQTLKAFKNWLDGLREERSEAK
jgi:hypothetical protein